MPRIGVTEKNESPERIKRCLSCKVPATECKGNRTCNAEQRVESKRIREVIRYAAERGMSIPETAEIVGKDCTYVYEVARKLKRKGKQ